MLYCPVLIMWVYVHDGEANDTEIFSCWLPSQLSFLSNTLMYCLIDSFSFLPWNGKNCSFVYQTVRKTCSLIFVFFRRCWELCKYNQQSWNHREAAGDVCSDLCRGFVVFHRWKEEDDSDFLPHITVFRALLGNSSASPWWHPSLKCIATL